MAIRAVFWDFGGVLTTSPFENFQRYEHEHGLPRDFLRTINATNPDTNAWARFERSELDLDAFDAAFEAESRAAGHPVPGRDVIRLLAGELRPEMVAALDRIRAAYRVACITNNVRAGEGPGMQVDADRAAAIQEVMARFEHVVESSRLGLRKPDPRIYRHACEVMAVAPEEVVYLDDLGVNLKPARELGMATIKVGDPDAALGELEGYLGIGLRGS
ncbi:HAD-IA family hydrolase [Aquisalimonas lutea]|uniref:HAD-IA family hydrolase n=1 Tax=Aquisalimonas lutea TaxID=1327750 RepID=UPI0025B4849E|nr:HAD-IA family hydrolase [Aquisalimonas lutea]MDN3518973.1 HAD-IA family hydrolase [Aquisalimonas lutea]